jgi:hypothetical protein
VLLLRLLVAAVVRTAFRLLLTFLATALISCSAPAAAAGACCNTAVSGSDVVDVTAAVVSDSCLQYITRRDTITKPVVSTYCVSRQAEVTQRVQKLHLTLSSVSGGHHPV